ncbi:MAG: hypothetical protein VX929_11190 [Pseudomonadota bacterium]|nr:hypothetical protein [Pseudomonadota bacterium]
MTGNRGHHPAQSDGHHDADAGDDDHGEATKPESPALDHATHYR